MSVRIQSHVWDRCDQTQGARLVMLMLADFASDDGRNAYPAYRTMARKCRIKERQLRYILKKLEEDGEITIVPRYDQNGRQTSNEYQLAQKYVVEQWGEGAVQCREGALDCRDEGALDCRPRSINKEHTNNNAHVREETDVRQEMGWQQLQAAIAKVMVRDLFLFDEETNKLVDALYGHYTPDQILRYYGQGGYWRRHDWRGSKSPQAPTVAHIKETIGDCKRFDESPEAFAPSKPKVTSEDVDAAFQQLSLICRRYGRNRFRDAKPELEKHGLDKVVDKLGWQNVCLTPADKLIWSFRSAYREQPVPA